MIPDAVDLSSEALLRGKVQALRKARGWSQETLAARMKMNQSLLSRRLTGIQHFQITDLDALASAFGITVPELFFDAYGQWDRRSKVDRRKGERRQVQQVLHDARLEIVPERDRLHFPPKEHE